MRHVTGPLAWLQLGRAQKMMGDEAAARKSYETFLDLWKNADPDIPDLPASQSRVRQALKMNCASSVESDAALPETRVLKFPG